jgi:hypothetical protein
VPLFPSTTLAGLIETKPAPGATALSSLAIVAVAVALPSTAPLSGFPSPSVNASFGATRVSPVTGTAMVRVVTSALKLSVPATAAESPSAAVAVPSWVATPP